MKNNIFLKISATLLVLLLCAPLLMACNDSTWQPPSDPSSSAADEEGKPVLPRFNGETINFYVSGEELQSRSIDIGQDDEPQNTVDLQIKRRNEQVEKELNVDIVLKKVGDLHESYSYLQPLLASEIYHYDVVSLYQYFDLGLAVGDTVGAFYNLYDLPEGVPCYLNLDASYWNKTLQKTTAYKEVSRFITGDLALTYTEGAFVSFVNATMWAEYADRIKNLEHSGGYDDVYDIVKNGYWTIDLWMELAKLCYEDDGNEVKDYTDQAGFMTYHQSLGNTMVDMLMAGSNVRLTGLTADGTPTIEIYSSKNIAFYEKLYTLLCESDTVTIPYTSDLDEEDALDIMEIFAEGNVLLNVNTLAWGAKHLPTMKDDYHILPLPMFDHSQFDKNSPSLGYTSGTADSISLYAICRAIGDEKLPVVTATLELMAYYSEKWVTSAIYDVFEKDPRAAEMIKLTENGLYTDFGYVWSHYLGDITWQFREHYSESHKIDNNLRSWDRNATGLLNTKLLEQFEECIYPGW